jgi:hypothetical protein
LGTLRWCPLALPAMTRIMPYMILGYGEKVNKPFTVIPAFHFVVPVKTGIQFPSF